MKIRAKKKNIVLVITTIFFIFVNSSHAFAWGPLTHPIINKEAFCQAVDPPSILSTSDESLRFYMDSGNAPDIIAYNTIRSSLSPFNASDRRFEYAHNFFPKPYEGTPKFGIYMSNITREYIENSNKRRFGKCALVGAYGWLSHQLADRITHQPDSGYSETKFTFSSSGSVNHAAAEFGVDCIMYTDYPLDSAKTKVQYRSALIHESAIKFFNEGLFEDTELPLYYPPQKILNCPTVKNMGRNWSKGVVVTKAMIGSLAVANPVLFNAIKDWYSDYNDDEPINGNAFNRSVFEVKKFLENPYGTSLAKANSSFPLRAVNWLRHGFKKASLKMWALIKENKSWAQKEEVEKPGESLYYGFISKLVDEAELLGAIEIEENIVQTEPDIPDSKEYEYDVSVIDQTLFSQALTNVINKDLQKENSQETKTWAKFMQGLYLLSDFTFQEIITRAEDFIPPIITDINPSDGSYINDSTPFISARVVDDPFGIGLDLDALSFTMNGNKLPVSYIPELNLIGYQIPYPLSDGSYTLNILAQDRAENREEQTFSFTIDTIPPEISHTILSRIINIKKGTKAELAVNSNEPVTYLMEVFRVRDEAEEQKGEKIYEKEFPQVDTLAWDGKDGSSNSVPNGAYFIEVASNDRAQNTFKFFEMVNVNNEAGK